MSRLHCLSHAFRQVKLQYPPVAVGGSPTSSICVTDAAPSRCAFATQSAPVSPPPITTTCRPAALIVSRGRGRRRAGDLRPELPRDPAVALEEVLHREVDAVELPSRHGQVARHAGADREDDGVVLAAQLVGGDVGADVDAVAELDALVHELAQPALDEALLDLEVRHAEADEPAARLVALVDDHACAPRG